jgi:hypothetical protein
LGQLKIVTNSLGLLKDGWNNFGSFENADEQTSGMLKMEKKTFVKKLWVCCKKLLKKSSGLLKRRLKKLWVC